MKRLLVFLFLSLLLIQTACSTQKPVEDSLLNPGDSIYQVLEKAGTKGGNVTEKVSKKTATEQALPKKRSILAIFD